MKKFLLGLIFLILSSPALASVLATDDFLRGDSIGLGPNWAQRSFQTNQFDISGNKAVPHSATSGDSCSYYTAGTWPNDQYSKAKVTVSGTSGGASGIGVTVRTEPNLYGIVIDHAGSSNAHLIKRLNTSFVDISGVTQSFSDGDTLEIRAIGTTISAHLNGGAAFISTTDTDIAGGRPGLYFSTSETSASADDWEGGDFTSGTNPISVIPGLIIRRGVIKMGNYR